MQDKFRHGMTGFCDRAEVKADNNVHWFPRTCCGKHAKFDKRTPGLFKLEYEGDEMIGLCSKSYVVANAVYCISYTLIACSYKMSSSSEYMLIMLII